MDVSAWVEMLEQQYLTEWEKGGLSDSSFSSFPVV